MTGNQLPALTHSFESALDKLADTVRHVVDLVAGPKRLRAKARAQADTAIILARGQAEAQDIEARAVERIRKREVRRQQNIEAITVEAGYVLPSPDQLSSTPVEEDWTTRFFEECKDISNKEMQALWARILAREVAQPGSFSPRTLTVVRDLTKEDAELFTRLCSFVWDIHGRGNVLVLHEVPASGLNFSMLTHLGSMGLIEFHNLSGFVLRDEKDVQARYFGQSITLTSPNKRELDIGRAMLTIVGHELCSICGARPDDSYRLMTMERWRHRGWVVAALDEGASESLQGLTVASS